MITCINPNNPKWLLFHNSTVDVYQLWNGSHWEIHKTQSDVINRFQEVCQDLQNYIDCMNTKQDESTTVKSDVKFESVFGIARLIIDHDDVVKKIKDIEEKGLNVSSIVLEAEGFTLYDIPGSIKTKKTGVKQ